MNLKQLATVTVKHECKMVRLQTMIYTLTAISVKIPITFFTGLEKKNPQIHVATQNLSRQSNHKQKEQRIKARLYQTATTNHSHKTRTEQNWFPNLKKQNSQQLAGGGGGTSGREKKQEEGSRHGVPRNSRIKWKKQKSPHKMTVF